MGGIAEEDIDRVKASVSIVDLVSRFVPLKKTGRNFVGLCPFHAENTPSFNVNPERQIFKCFGCGKAGNVFSFLMEFQKMDFPQAVRSLAEECGIPLSSSPVEDRRKSDLRKNLFQATEFAASFFRRTLLSAEGKGAREYLESRRISPAISEAFNIGLSPQDWDALIGAAGNRGIPPEILEKAGLALPRQKGGGYYDRFRGRLIFPILDLQGKVLGFGGRVMAGEGPKYINSPETAVYHKGSVLYGLHVARNGNLEDDGVIFMEGYTDVIAAHQAGVTNAVASLGTALTPDQASLARRFTRKAWLMYDADEAGLSAMERGVEVLLGAEMDVRVVTLPGAKDPADFLAEGTAEQFRAIMASSPDAFDFRIAAIGRRTDLSSIGGKARAVDEMLAVVRAAPNPVHKQLLVKRISDATGVSEAAIRERLASEAPRRAGRPEKREEPEICSTSRIEADIIEALICDNTLIDSAASEFPAERFRDKELKSAAEIIFRLRCEGRQVGISDVLRSQPKGLLSVIVDRLAYREVREGRDFEEQYRKSVQSIERHCRNERIADVKSELRRTADPKQKEGLLRRLQELKRSCDAPGMTTGKE